MADPPGTRLSVEISDAQRHLAIDRAALARLVRGALAGEGVARASISLTLLDDPAIRELNRRHLEHDWPTDVITFRLSEPGDDELAAELLVSAQMAAETAAAAGSDPADELALYVVHGLLHLCGYDDRDPAAAAAMRRREDEVLRREGRSNPFDRTPGRRPEDLPCRS